MVGINCDKEMEMGRAMRRNKLVCALEKRFQKELWSNESRPARNYLSMVLPCPPELLQLTF